MFVLCLLDSDNKPFRTIGPFIYEDMALEWKKEQGIFGAHIVLPLESHGWDN